MSEQEQPIQRDRSAPEGSFCAAHDETPAIATCPRCGKHACIVCWQPAVDRCDSCLRRDPAEAAPPLPWEQPERSFASRLFGTIATAWSPVRSAPAFGRDELGPAITFALLTFVPLALLWGIIPFTKTLLFSGPFQVALQGTPTPSSDDILRDVAAASILGLVLSLAQALMFAVPYISLVRAYGSSNRQAVPVRAMLYRGFLIPAQQTIYFLLKWALIHEGATIGQDAFLLLVSLIALVLLLSTMWSAARLGAGVGPFISFLVVIVPVTLWQYAGPLLAQLLTP